jgi:hypothetical protein
MLVATRDHDPRPHGQNFHDPLHGPPKSMMMRFSGGLQFVGSLIGIPLALIGGYSTYHASFSPEAKCQALRANIITMLDKKADASTLRMLVQRDVTAFQRDCVEVDPDAVAAFKTLVTAAELKPEPAKGEPLKAEAAAKVEAVKAEPVKLVAKPETPRKVQPAPAAKRDIEKSVAELKAQPKIEPKPEAKPEIKPEAKVEAKPVEVKTEAAAAEAKPFEVKTESKSENRPAEPKPVEAKLTEPKPAEPKLAEPKPTETASLHPEAEASDTAWIASVREVLRESAARVPAAEPDIAASMPPPLVVTPAPTLATDPSLAVAHGFTPPRPPGDLTPVKVAPSAPPPVPPAVIPDAEAPPPSGD